MAWDRCIFDVLARLGPSERQSVCDFADHKATQLEQDVKRILTVTDESSSLLGGAERQRDAAQAFIDRHIQSSPLLAQARTIAPDCPAVGDVFQGAVDSAVLAGRRRADAEYVVRQIKNRAAVLDSLHAEAAEAASALRDICGIIQSMGGQ